MSKAEIDQSERKKKLTGKCRIDTDWTYKGLTTVILENEFLKVSILADFGAKIFEFIHKPTDHDFMYHNPRIEVRTPVYGVNVDNWWTGGIDEAIPTGHASIHEGEEYPYLGEVWSLPWSYEVVKREKDRVQVKLWRTTVIAPLKIERWITLEKGERIVRFHHKVTNFGQRRFNFLWGIHPGFYVNPNYRIDLPAEDVFVEESLPNNRLGKRGAIYRWPYATDKHGNEVDMRQVQPKEAQTCDFHYAVKLTDGWFALTDTFMKEGFGFVFPKDVFRVIWLWLVYGGWRSLYCAAIEPWTGYPAKLDIAVKEGVYSTLEAGESLECDTSALIYEDVSKVERITANGNVVGGI